MKCKLAVRLSRGPIGHSRRAAVSIGRVLLLAPFFLRFWPFGLHTFEAPSTPRQQLKSLDLLRTKATAVVTAFGARAGAQRGGTPWQDLVKKMCQLERVRHVPFCIGSRFGLLWPSKTYRPSPTPREHSPFSLSLLPTLCGQSPRPKWHWHRRFFNRGGKGHHAAHRPRCWSNQRLASSWQVGV